MNDHHGRGPLCDEVGSRRVELGVVIRHLPRQALHVVLGEPQSGSENRHGNNTSEVNTAKQERKEKKRGGMSPSASESIQDFERNNERAE